jgi:hypothetical protein
MLLPPLAFLVAYAGLRDGRWDPTAEYAKDRVANVAALRRG